MAFASDKTRQGAAGQGAAGGFSIDNSLRFNDDDSAYLNRTFGTATNRKKWTWSCWAKLSEAGSSGHLFAAGTSGTQEDSFYFYNDNQFDIGSYSSGYAYRLRTSAKFRDPSAWYHFLVAVDTTIASPSGLNQRIKLWVNGSQVTDFETASYPSLNAEFHMNASEFHSISKNAHSSAGYYDGYLAEVHFIDGTALDPTSFGEEDTDYKHWKPKEVTGLTYGTNGFYLDFKLSAATSSGLGNDANGSNNWTPNNLQPTDQMVDTPTNNFCTLNPLWTGTVTNKEGNLRQDGGSNNKGQHSTFSTTGKAYYEVYMLNVSDGYPGLGYVETSATIANSGFQGSNAVGTNAGTLYKYGTGQGGSTCPNYVNTDIVMVALDASSGKIWYGLNGTWFGSGNPSTGSNAQLTGLSTTDSWTPLLVAGSNVGTSQAVINFGQDSSFAGNKTTGSANANDGNYGDFYYTPPTDFLALCTSNLPAPAVKPQENFGVVAYAGTSATKTISSLSLQPDFLWIKARSGDSQQHLLVDSVRGTYTSSASKTLYRELYLNDSLVENHHDSNYGAVSALTSNGFSLDTDSSWPFVNESGRTYVAWNWKSGGAPTVDNSASAGATPTAGSVKIDGVNLGSALAGSIAATRLSANVDSGFSIATYTGTGANATIGHGLSKAPEMLIIKNRDQVDDWIVYHEGIGNTSMLRLNTSTAKNTYVSWWNNTSPTSTVFTVSTEHRNNASSEDYIAYCFHSVDGYSKVGSYTGNGSADGPFVYTGFRPAYVMYKNSGANQHWIIFNSEVDTYNPTDRIIYPSTAVAEQDASANLVATDILSNGYKIRGNDGLINTSGITYIFIAFAEYPFKYANAR
jgi:hypothetical protein